VALRRRKRFLKKQTRKPTKPTRPAVAPTQTNKHTRARALSTARAASPSGREAALGVRLCATPGYSESGALDARVLGVLRVLDLQTGDRLGLLRRDELRLPPRLREPAGLPCTVVRTRCGVSPNSSRRRRGRGLSPTGPATEAGGEPRSRRRCRH
jgi:hypothetical protein